jgi:predicted dehydrogenase
VTEDSAPLRLGLLGCADIAQRRALPSLARLRSFTLTAVASRDAGRAKRFAERFGGTPVTGYEELLARDDLDAVYVPLPAALHARWAQRALDAGLHVLVEKPAAVTPDEARRLTRLAHERGLVVMENFAFVRHTQQDAVRDLLAEGAIGELRGLSAEFAFPPLKSTDIRYRPELGGGALLDAGVYPLRLARRRSGTANRRRTCRRPRRRRAADRPGRRHRSTGLRLRPLLPLRLHPVGVDGTHQPGPGLQRPGRLRADPASGTGQRSGRATAAP